MTNVCKNCGETVIPDPEDGHCPYCGEKAGYTVSKVVTFKHRIEDNVSKYQKQIERLNKIIELYKGTKIEYKLNEEIKKFEKIINDLNNLSSEQSIKKINIDEKIEISDKVAVEKKPEGKTESFTMDSVHVKANSKIKEGNELIDTTNGDILSELRESRLENKGLHSKNTRLAIFGLAGTFGGLFIGLFGGNFIKPIQIGIDHHHVAPIINATNMTNIVNSVTNSTVVP